MSRTIWLPIIFTALLSANAIANAQDRATKKYRQALSQKSTQQTMQELQDLQIVDCLLPGKVRRLGNSTYLGPRRPVQTTTVDCRIKGGEYTAFDRADYRTALNVWLPSAQAGDAEAQAHVGEIFERGLGDSPNYEAARIWYLRAAKQGSTRAQFALGTLYEQGLGVPKNQVAALNWYRQAWGIEEDHLIYASSARQLLRESADQLQDVIVEKEQQIEALRTELQHIREAAESADTQAKSRVGMLESLLADLREQEASQRTELSQLLAQVEAQNAVVEDQSLRLREPTPDVADQKTPEEPGRQYKDLALGRYFALLIGNADYDNLENLATPLNDIARARDILQNKYGFTVFTLDNGNSVEVMRAINNLSDVLTENDNLLLFFAGHGSRLPNNQSETGYWLPRNAERPPNNTFWVSNEFVSGHLARLSAKRVLVVADSCYAGLLASEPSLTLMQIDAPQYANNDFLKFKLSKRARLLLSSGGDRPVLDQGADGHSVFANAFLDELEANQGLLASPDLFLSIRDRVTKSAAGMGFEQEPQLRSIKSAGHEVGDFFFVPTVVN